MPTKEPNLAKLVYAKQSSRVRRAERKDKMNEQQHRNEMLAFLSDNLSQSEAAMVAVLAAHKGQEANEELREHSGDKSNDPVNVARVEFWEELEEAMVDSIKRNDGRVVYWIGVAAKQINPLLS